MLYSPATNVAFAHYPKTAGSAIAEWFRRSFPDARYVKPGHPHVDVRRSVAWLSGGQGLRAFERLRYLARRSKWRLPRETKPSIAYDVRIIGVVRDPWEMLVSLYEYWGRRQVIPRPHGKLMTAAHAKRFVTFLRLATSGMMPKYEDFFDAGGATWPNTRLVHFNDLEGGIARACREFALSVPVLLPRINCGTGHLSRMGEYDRLAGTLKAEVRRSFAWYYDTFGHADHPATCRRTRPRAAAA